MKNVLLPLFTLLFLTSNLVFGQYEPPDCEAIEEVIVERYYISDANDATDEDGGELVEGSTTWRVYIDLKPDYVLESVYGNSSNPLSIETTTVFFNNEDRGEEYGDAIPANRLGDNTVALDSYLTFNAASDEHLAVLKEDDDDGNIIAGDENDGGSEGIDGGLLVNDVAEIGIPLTSADGLIEGTITSVGTGNAASVTGVQIDASVFGDENVGGSFNVNNGAWAVLGGVVGPTDDNRILIAQLTTNGVLTFEINVRVGIPDELQCSSDSCYSNMDFVAVLTESQMQPTYANDRICTLDGLTFDSSTVGVDENGFSAEGFELFPNPASNRITVAINPNRTGRTTFRIFDIYGKLIDSGTGSELTQGVFTYDVSALSAGIYLIELENDGETATERFIKR
jgi:hypothetical protein